MTTDAVLLWSRKYNHTNPEPHIKAAPTSKPCLFAKLRFHFLSVFFLEGDVVSYDNYCIYYANCTQLIDIIHSSISTMTGKGWITGKSGFHLTSYPTGARNSFSRNKAVGTWNWAILPSSFTASNYFNSNCQQAVCIQEHNFQRPLPIWDTTIDVIYWK
jgi:hypothetical protein